MYTKETLIAKLKEITEMGWIRNARPGNAGGVGNTLEDLLGIKESNLPIPNAAEWELKCQRIGRGSLTTLFHMEPSPRTFRFVPNVFLLFTVGNIRLFRKSKAFAKQFMVSKEAIEDSKLLLTALPVKSWYPLMRKLWQSDMLNGLLQLRTEWVSAN